MRNITLAVFTILFAFASLAVAEEKHHEISMQGTGFFTTDTQDYGMTQHSTSTGGFLIGYRFHFNKWLAAEGDYGYSRNTQQNFTNSGNFNVQSDVHQFTGDLVVTIPSPHGATRLHPFLLAGAGALIFDPTDKLGGSVIRADRQAKAAFVYGGGLDYTINAHVLVRAGYRGLFYEWPDFSLQSINSGNWTHTAQPSAGIVIRF